MPTSTTLAAHIDPPTAEELRAGHLLYLLRREEAHADIARALGPRMPHTVA